MMRVVFPAFARKVPVLLGFLLLLLIPLGALSAQQGSPEVLTNASVVKMVQARLGVDVIVEQIVPAPATTRSQPAASSP